MKSLPWMVRYTDEVGGLLEDAEAAGKSRSRRDDGFALDETFGAMEYANRWCESRIYSMGGMKQTIARERSTRYVAASAVTNLVLMFAGRNISGLPLRLNRPMAPSATKRFLRR